MFVTAVVVIRHDLLLSVRRRVRGNRRCHGLLWWTVVVSALSSQLSASVLKFGAGAVVIIWF